MQLPLAQQLKPDHMHGAYVYVCACQYMIHILAELVHCKSVMAGSGYMCTLLRAFGHRYEGSHATYWFPGASC